MIQKLDFQWKFDDPLNEADPLNNIKFPPKMEHQPKSIKVKEEVVGLEGDNYTERGYSVKTLGMQGSRFNKQNKINYGTMTKWDLEIREKGVVINLELRTMKVTDLKKKAKTLVVTHGEYVKLYEKIPDNLRNDASMEQAIKELAKLLIQTDMIKVPSEDIEIIPHGRKYIIMHGSIELDLIE